MQPPPIPEDEAQRLQRLNALDVLYTPATKAYDEVTRLARLRFDTAIVLITLVTADEQWFKSADGLDACSTHRDISFCGHAITGEDVFVVQDALEDLRFSDNPLVTGPPYIRFYAGYPLRTGPGSALGTLCIMDTKPRAFDEDDREQLARFGRMAENLLYEGEQMLDLATDAVFAERGLNRWELVDSLTGDWKFDAAETLSELSLRHAREDEMAICAISVHFQSMPGEEELTMNSGARMILKEGARQIRAHAPPQSAHFYDGHGHFVSILLARSMESASEAGKEVIRQLLTSAGWDRVTCEPPMLKHSVMSFGANEAGSTERLANLFHQPD